VIATLPVRAAWAAFFLALSACVAPAPTLPVGKSVVTIDCDGTPIEVFTYKPEGWRGERMLFVMHGTLRNADEYRDDAIAMAERFGALVVAPRFDKERFPSRRYQFGGLRDESGQALPPAQWTYAFVPKLAARLRAIEGRPELRHWIIGHSAGGQFVARMSAFQETGAERLVAANAGSHLFPTEELPFGYGFGGLPDALRGEERLQRYLAQPLTIYLGTADDHPDEYFDDSETAMKQGGGRLQRGRECFARAQALAAARGWFFGWTLVLAEEVEHDHTKMFDHPSCERALFGGRADQLNSTGRP
jgi:poly(3-hydroxybutyrate) depolymerase